MPVRIEANSEPIAGYRLIERLGGGGFGEVWKCEAPGGLYKAIKFVYGDMESVDDEDGSRAEQELKALNRVKTVHHPYILSLERYDIVEGQLMIVMELADRTLWDRFKECRAQGLPGIPRLELLNYLRETAEALDLMNDKFQLQHLDIKPQNLFLVFDHIKVADFGLVKDLGTKAAATITGGVTPVYAAPETFDGWLSRFSDQYSLAIVYQELLTGQRPFAGATMRQLVMQHLQGVPDLAPLPAADRPIVARSLSKEPDQRYPSCIDLVRGLQAATTAAAPLEEPDPAIPAEALPIEDDGFITRDARGKSSGFPERPVEPIGLADTDRPQVVPRRPDRNYVPAGHDTPNGANHETPPNTSARHTVPTVRRGGSAAEFHLAVQGPIQPALVIGLGGIGTRVLGQLRQQLTAELASADELPCVRLLGLDTDLEAIQTAGAGAPGQSLQPGELLATRLHRPSHYLKPRDGAPVTDGWLNPRLLYRIPREQNGAGLRPLGRLAFVDNYRVIERRLTSELEDCCTAAAQPAPRDRLAPRSLTPRVYIVSCLAGNTGGGMFLDAALAARTLLQRKGHGDAEIVGVFLLPAVEPSVRSTGLANTYAALAELNHFSRHPLGGKHQNVGAPFSRCVLFTLPHAGGSGGESATNQVLAAAGEFLYRDLATALGPAADERRLRLVQAGPAPQAGPTFHAVAFNRLSWPRQPLLDQGARRVCRRLVESWMSKDARPIADAVARWADEKWDAIGLRSEALIARLHELCEKIVRQPPDQLVTAVTGPLAEALAPRTGKGDGSPALGPAVTALAELDRLLGLPDECRPPHQSAPTPGVLETALTEATAKLADLCEQRLAEQVVRLIEDPLFRLVGAEEALRRLGAAAERALQAQETLARELHERAVLLYQTAQRALEAPVPPPSASQAAGWKLSFGKRTPGPAVTGAAAELLEVIRQYPKARYHALVLQHVNRIYVGLRGQLSDQLREVGFCRQRLGELAGILHPVAPPGADDPALPARVLLPTGCRTLQDALDQMERGLTRDDLHSLDQHIQTVIRQQCRALVNVCLGSSAVVRTLAPAMLARARDFLAPRFGSTSVAELLLNGREGDEAQRIDHAIAELQELFQRAAPKNGPTRPDAHLHVALLPDDATGRQLQTLLRDDIPDLIVVGSDRPDEIVFFREQVHLTAAGIEQLGVTAHECYRQRLAADPTGVHSRDDVPEWQALAPAAR